VRTGRTKHVKREDTLILINHAAIVTVVTPARFALGAGDVACSLPTLTTGRTELTSQDLRPVCFAAAAFGLLAMAPLPARADFFDSARQTIQTDIPRVFQKDIPHFFQDDIPCAFGYRPTSGTRTECKSSSGSEDSRVPPPPPLNDAPPSNDTSATPTNSGERRP
jgi:hypothetical protein